MKFENATTKQHGRLGWEQGNEPDIVLYNSNNRGIHHPALAIGPRLRGKFRA